MKVSNSISVAIFTGATFIVGVVLSASILGSSIIKFKTADRYVSVKGFAEREVKADLALWPITFKEGSDDLVALRTSVEAKREIVRTFLKESGFPETTLTNAPLKIQDTRTEAYSNNQAPYRYLCEATVTVRTNDVAGVRKAMERTGDLVGRGVAVTVNWENRSEFMFTGLAKIKPEMIEEATKNARMAAEKFAQDSQSDLGKIRSAQQGMFSIEDRDANSPDVKVVRVVTTVDYYLND